MLFIPALSGEIFWTAAILTALGTTFGTVLGLDTPSAIVLSALIAIAYTALGLGKTSCCDIGISNGLHLEDIPRCC